MSRWHQPNTIAIRVDHRARFVDILSRDNHFAIAARRCLRQGLHVVVQLDNGPICVKSVLFLPTAHRQNLVESKTCTLLPDRSVGSRLFVESPTSMTFFAGSICRTTGKLKDTRKAGAAYIKYP